MTKGLEALQELRKQSETHRWLEQQFEKEWLNTIEKELKALEIIREKGVNVKILMECTALEHYNYCIYDDKDDSRRLTQEEFDLLKEVLG